MKIRYYLLLGAYYLMVVLPHEQIGKWIADIFVTTTRVRYDGIMLGILCVLGLIVAMGVYRKSHKSDRRLLLIYSLLTILFIILCINFLFVINVEAIHFIQYAIFAIICYQINSSYFRTMFWSVLAGALDELYQYSWLAPDRTEYYDFNDVVINAVGAGIGLLLIRTLRRPVIPLSFKDFLRSSEFVVTIGIILFIGIGLLSGMLSYGPDPDAHFCFMKVENIGFWKTDRRVTQFHVIKPLEGTLIAIALILTYSGLKTGYERIDSES